MQFQIVKQLNALYEQLGIPNSWPDSRLSLDGAVVMHYLWLCGCAAAATGPGLVSLFPCERHVLVGMDNKWEVA